MDTPRFFWACRPNSQSSDTWGGETESLWSCGGPARSLWQVQALHNQYSAQALVTT